MTPEAGKLVAELLAQQLGLSPDEVPATFDRDSLVAAITISLLKRSNPGEHIANARLQGIAEIVGACSRCFGDDSACGECGGEGTPGYHPPEREALLQWIAPALHRAGFSIVDRRNSATGYPLPGGSINE